MMGFSWRTSCFVMITLLLSACDQNGGAMPLNGKTLLSSFDGPKIPTIQDNQREAAKDAEKNNDFAQASQIYQQILEKDPETTDVIQLLADSLRRNSEYDKAINVYDSLLAKDASNLPAKEGKALALLEKGDFETPTTLFDEVLKLDNKRWKSLNGMGILFVTRGLHSESIKYFEEALKQNPNNTSVMNNLGLALALNKHFEQAIDMLLKASGQSTVNSFGRKRIDLNLALVYASAGKLDEARKIAEIYLNGPELNNNLGLYAHLAKDDGLAKSYLNMALTESKTYYGKAWDNLETLSSGKQSAVDKDVNNSAVSTESRNTESKGRVKTSLKSKSRSKIKDNTVSSKEEAKKITVTQEPNATKSEVKSLGKIIAHELEKSSVDNKNNSDKTASDNLLIMPNEIKPEEKISEEKKSAVDSVIDDMAKTPTQYIEKSLGTISIPSRKANGTTTSDILKNNPQ